MRILLLFISLGFIGLFFSCFFDNVHAAPTVKYIEPKKTICDELGQRVFNCDSALNVRDEQLTACRDSLKLMALRNDSVTADLFLSNYKVEKVRYYLNICLKNKTQDKFLKGWIRRAIN
jgi:hypothetical protein